MLDAAIGVGAASFCFKPTISSAESVDPNTLKGYIKEMLIHVTTEVEQKLGLSTLDLWTFIQCLNTANQGEPKDPL